MTGPGANIAIIGVGPRGLSVLERLLALARANGCAPLTVWTIDDFEPGVGRIWRPDQPGWLTMNTIADQVTMYTHEDAGPVGPSLVQWAGGPDDPEAGELGPEDYAPRRMYGLYLRSVYSRLCAQGIPGVEVRPLVGRVASMLRRRDEYRLELEDGRVLPPMHAVVLATGHSVYEPEGAEHELLAGAAGDRYLRGDSAADLDLDRARPRGRVGVLGLGLSFYDVALSLTVGRGGHFERERDGKLRYRASGREPVILAGSRSGMPYPARGRNQKQADGEFHPCFLTRDAVTGLREQSLRATGSRQLDFTRDIWPLLTAEVQFTYDCALLRQVHGPRAERRFHTAVRAAVADGRDAGEVRRDHGLPASRLDLRALTRPFAEHEFTGTRQFHDRLLDLLRRDVREAARGNVGSPLKAALDVLRDVRSVVRGVVDFSGLLPRSHRDDFLSWFHPLNNFLSAGPPALRVEQAAALIEADVLHVCGPGTRVAAEARGAGFVLESPRVAGSRRTVELLVDARQPQPNLRRDTSPLIRRLIREGIVCEYTNVDPVTGEQFATGGLSVEQDTFRVIDASGQVLPNVCAVGIPTEHTRWFTHMGSSRPGRPTLFSQDADRVARSVLAGTGLAAGTLQPAGAAS